jgi:hypothetical protein
MLNNRSISERFSFIVNVTTFFLLPLGHNMSDPLEIGCRYMNERENIGWVCFSLSLSPQLSVTYSWQSQI